MTTHYPRRTTRPLRKGDRVRDLFALTEPFGDLTNYPGAHRFGTVLTEPRFIYEVDYTGSKRRVHPDQWVWVLFDDHLEVEVPASGLVRL